MSNLKPHIPAGWVGGFEVSNRGVWHEGRHWALCWCHLAHNSPIHLRAKTRKIKAY